MALVSTGRWWRAVALTAIVMSSVAQARTRVLVLPVRVQTRGLDAAEVAHQVVDELRAEFDVWTAQEASTALGSAAWKRIQACQGDPACIGARARGIRPYALVTVGLDNAGPMWRLRLDLVDGGTTAPIRLAAKAARDPDEALLQVQELLRRLVAPLPRDIPDPIDAPPAAVAPAPTPAAPPSATGDTSRSAPTVASARTPLPAGALNAPATPPPPSPWTRSRWTQLTGYALGAAAAGWGTWQGARALVTRDLIGSAGPEVDVSSQVTEWRSQATAANVGIAAGVALAVGGYVLSATLLRDPPPVPVPASTGGASRPGGVTPAARPGAGPPALRPAPARGGR